MTSTDTSCMIQQLVQTAAAAAFTLSPCMWLVFGLTVGLIDLSWYRITLNRIMGRDTQSVTQ